MFSIGKTSMRRVIVRIRSNNAGRALNRCHDHLINVALVLLPATRHPLPVAASPQSYIPQYKPLGNHLVQTLHVTSAWSHCHVAPHSPQTDQLCTAMHRSLHTSLPSRPTQPWSCLLRLCCFPQPMVTCFLSSLPALITVLICVPIEYVLSEHLHGRAWVSRVTDVAPC